VDGLPIDPDTYQPLAVSQGRWLAALPMYVSSHGSADLSVSTDTKSQNSSNVLFRGQITSKI